MDKYICKLAAAEEMLVETCCLGHHSHYGEYHLENVLPRQLQEHLYTDEQCLFSPKSRIYLIITDNYLKLQLVFTPTKRIDKLKKLLTLSVNPI